MVNLYCIIADLSYRRDDKLITINSCYRKLPACGWNDLSFQLKNLRFN
jgi:hypothetical protein